MSSDPQASSGEGLVYKLKTPIPLGETNTVTELRFPARLSGRHLRRYAVGARGMIDAETCLLVASDASGQPDAVFAKMDGSDVAEVVRIVTGFFVLHGFLQASPDS